MFKPVLSLTFALTIAACGSRDAEDAAPGATATPTVVVTPTMRPPQREEFTAAWTEACPEAEPVNKALCKSKGLADTNFTCDFALGDDEYRRNNAELTPREGKWVLADPANACEAQ